MSASWIDKGIICTNYQKERRVEMLTSPSSGSLEVWAGSDLQHSSVLCVWLRKPGHKRRDVEPLSSRMRAVTTSRLPSGRAQIVQEGIEGSCRPSGLSSVFSDRDYSKASSCLRSCRRVVCVAEGTARGVPEGLALLCRARLPPPTRPGSREGAGCFSEQNHLQKRPCLPPGPCRSPAM